jgi:hypothetical protein
MAAQSKEGVKQVNYLAVVESLGEGIFLAGERVAPGIYVDIESRREYRLDEEDYLPASLNGRVAAYVLKPATWGKRDAHSSAARELAGAALV